jgi:hypothetical protein
MGGAFTPKCSARLLKERAMFETAIAQLRFAGSLASGRPFALWSLEWLIKALHDTRREFGAIGPEGAEVVRGPELDDATRREMQLRRFRAQATRAARDTEYYSRLFATLGIDAARLRHDDIAHIPLTPKEAVRDQPDAFVRRASLPPCRWNQLPGSASNVAQSCSSMSTETPFATPLQIGYTLCRLQSYRAVLITRVTRSPTSGADSACGSMVPFIFCMRFFRAPRGKTAYQQK